MRQGITSFITGNCGLSMTGFAQGSPYIDKIGAGLFHMDELTGVYPDVDALFSAIDGNTPLNIASLTGHCSARASGTGYRNRPLTPERSRREMLALLEENLSRARAAFRWGSCTSPASTRRRRSCARSPNSARATTAR